LQVGTLLGMASGKGKHVFVSYVKEDSERVRKLCSLLDSAQIPYWKDRESLAPGDQWKPKIREAIREDALVFLACFSENSRARAKTFMNEELTIAVEEFRQRSSGTKWLIPVRFDDGDVPYWDLGAGRDLSYLNYANLFGDNHAQESVNLVSTIGRVLALDPGGRGVSKDASVRRRLRRRGLLLTALVAVLIVGTAAVIQFGPPFVSRNVGADTTTTPRPKTSSSLMPPPRTSRSEPAPTTRPKPPVSESAPVTTMTTPSTNPAQPEPPGASQECDYRSPPLASIYTNGSPSSQRWGAAYTVHSTGCYHWGSVDLDQVLPDGYQVDVTLTRYLDGDEYDHRFCYIKAGGDYCTAVPAIRTESCQWTYKTTAVIYRASGTSRVAIAKSVHENQTNSCDV
jgi:hypothetical protein